MRRLGYRSPFPATTNEWTVELSRTIAQFIRIRRQYRVGGASKQDMVRRNILNCMNE